MDDIWQDNGGRVSWLENPGNANGNWVRRTIGNSPGMHRLKAGHFTRKDRIQIVAVPIIVSSSNLTTPAPVIIFTAPEDPKTAQGDWPSEVVWQRHLVHEVVVVTHEQSGGETPFDQVILAGRDGVDVLWYDHKQWQTYNVGTGLPKTLGDPYWGAGSVAVGRVDDDYAGYICSAEVRQLEVCDNTSGLISRVHRPSTAIQSPSTPSLRMRRLALSTLTGPDTS